MRLFSALPFVSVRSMLCKCLIIIFLLNGVLACSGSEKYTLLDEDTFRSLLKEIHLMDAAVAVNNNNFNMVEPLEEDYEPILERYGVTKEDLYYNFIHYHKNEQIGSIYDKMMEEMTVEKVKIEKQVELEEGEKDSTSKDTDKVKRIHEKQMKKMNHLLHKEE